MHDDHDDDGKFQTEGNLNVMLLMWLIDYLFLRPASRSDTYLKL